MDVKELSLGGMEIGIDLINGFFINFSAIWFIIGLIIFLGGLFFVGVSIYARIKGQRVTGKIIGAVHKKRIKKKIRDGKEVEKIKTENYLVYEYQKPDGTMHKELSSEGFQKNDNYQTGQEVNLLVCPAKGFDDVYDADSKSAIIFGIILMAIGGGLLGWTIVAYGMKKSFWLLIVVMLGAGFLKFYEKISDGKDTMKGEMPERPPVKQFTEEDIKTVEEVIDIMKKGNKEESASLS